MPLSLIDLVEQRVQLLIAGGVIEVHRVVLHLGDEFLEVIGAVFDAAKLQNAVLHVRRKRILQRTARHADDGKLLR